MAIAYNTDVTSISGNLGGAAYPDGITIAQAQSNITAAGTNQATATQIGANGQNPAVNQVAVASGTGVMLPGGQPTSMVMVYPATATNALLVYPQVGGTINDGAVNASVSLPARKGVIFMCKDALNWFTIGL